MINKERLQQLIKQGATIWCIVKFLDIYYEKPQKIIPITLNNTYNISVNYNRPFLYQKTYIFYKVCDIDNCYETEEDALWELEMSATLTETLKMPKWEDIEFDEIGYYIKMFHMRHNYDFFGKLMITKEKIYVEEMVIGYQKKLYFEKLRNKENYIEACKLCLKLFKGER